MPVSSESIRLDPRKLAQTMRGPDGPVMRATIVLAERIKRETIASLKSGFPRDFLGPSIVKRIGFDGRGGYVDVLSARTKTEPHPIEGNPLLVFFWKKAGRVVFLRHVNHPGSEFGPYLRRKLTEAVLRVRGRV